jgi:hypothetical protein
MSAAGQLMLEFIALSFIIIISVIESACSKKKRMQKSKIILSTTFYIINVVVACIYKYIYAGYGKVQLIL